MLRAAQRFQQGFALAFSQAEQGIDVGAAIAIFGKETGQRFGGMIGADHHARGHTGNAVLRLHAFTRFFVAAHEVAQGQARLFQCFFAGQHRLFDVHHHHAIGFDKVDGILTILFIFLDAIGQAHGDKLVVLLAGLFAQFANRHLAQLTCQRGVLAAADAQHQGFQKRMRLEIGLQKIDAGANFLLGIDNRFRVQRADYFLLQCHYSLLMSVPVRKLML